MYLEGEEISVRLTGAGPYGLRLGGRARPGEPLIVAKLHKKSKARAAGVRVGDVVVSINGNLCHGMTLQTASDLVDFSRDLGLQLIRNHGYHFLLDDEDTSSSFRQGQHSPLPHSYQQQPTSRSLTTFPYLSGSDNNIIDQQSQATELFRHKVDNRQSVPLTSGDRRLRSDGEESDKEPMGKVAFGGSFRSKGWQSEQTRGTASDSEAERTIRRWGSGGGGRRWMPNISEENQSEFKESHLETSEEAQNSTQSFSNPSLSLLKPFLPTGVGVAKPERWRPPSATKVSFGETRIEPIASHPSEALVHEVVIWSSKPTEVEKLYDADHLLNQRKSLPWETKGKNVQPIDSETTVVEKVQAATRWQPQYVNNRDNCQPLKSGQPSPHVVATDNLKQPTCWQPPLATSDLVRSVSDFDRGLNDLDSVPIPELAGQRGQQHRWQPLVQPNKVDRPMTQPGHLEEPPRASQDDGVSPEVTSLFLRKVVTDGSALVRGGSDADATHDEILAGKKKLYADSSFYEDPENKYPTIEEQIKMARKVALLLTSPANKNAKGQKMFLKRKEQSYKWIIDPINSTFLPPLIITPPHLRPSSVTDEKTLSPGEVERMRLYSEKSLHDVVPFDVCSMLAAELREEKGRGGRMFAKRRDKADQTSAPETTGLVQVPATTTTFQRRKYAPETDTKNRPGNVLETVTSFPPPSKTDASFKPAAITTIQDPSDQVDGYGGLTLPVNRLKNMLDLPKAKITPWDSAAQYGTVEPAFEHLKGYYPYTPEESHQHEIRNPMTSKLASNQIRTTKLPSHSHETYGHNQEFRGNEIPIATHRLTSYTNSVPSGAADTPKSSNFTHQLSQTDRKVYRPVNFQVGSRSFN